MMKNVGKYITRYNPSYQRLKLYCEKWNSTIPEYFDEAVSAKNWGEHYYCRRFGKEKIAHKLREKCFNDITIGNTIALFDFHVFSHYENTIRQMIQRHLGQGKSLHAIRSALIFQFPRFRHEISITMREYSDHEAFTLASARARSSYDITSIDGIRKYTAYLQRRGYSGQQIRNSLSSKMDDFPEI